MERKNPFVPLDPRPLPPSGMKPLEVALMRGMAIESRHRVHALVCDSGGEVVHQWGNPEFTFFPRSTVKIIQAAAWLSRGQDQGWNVSDSEIAIACGSHMAEPGHVEVVQKWLDKVGLSQADLECGAHDPTHRPSAHALVRAGEKACPIHNNCSGKHCGLLMACLSAGWPTAGYSSYDHPVQEELRLTMGEFLEMDLRSAPWGIDGCGIPSYCVSLRSLAMAMAKTANPGGLSSQIQEAIARITRAIKAEPWLIGGTENFSSQVVAETEGRVFAKVGAEGVYGAWIPGVSLGIALKCEDGTGRAAEAALSAVLRELGFPLSFYSPLVTRWGGEVVGQFICG